MNAKALLNIADFAALVARKCPTAQRSQVAHVVTVLVRTAGRLRRLAEKDCNYGLTPRDERAWNRAVDLVKTQCQAIGLTAELVLHGDPRGYVLRLRFADGTFNTWGGEEGGYGVPTAD